MSYPQSSRPAPITNGRAIAAFVLGVIAFFVPIPFVLGIIAIMLGHSARREIASYPGQEGEGFATAGIILGWIDVVLSTIGILVLLIFLFGMGAMSMH